jgi:ethanolaminephosphotransferase
MFTWILAQWEEYHTGVMRYGNAFYGVLEANYCLAAVHVLTMVVGSAWWQQPVNSLLPPTLQLPQLNGWGECCWTDSMHARPLGQWRCGGV